MFGVEVARGVDDRTAGLSNPPETGDVQEQLGRLEDGGFNSLYSTTRFMEMKTNLVICCQILHRDKSQILELDFPFLIFQV